MSKHIKIKKGLDIRLMGEAEKVICTFQSPCKYALKPADYIGITPKLLVNEGDFVKSGSPVFFSKTNEKLLFTSPVSGTITQIKRGEKRVIEEIEIEPSSQMEYLDFGKENVNTLSRESIIEKMLISGLWIFLRQRPYSIIANPAGMPKAIFVSGFDTSPLAPDYDIIVHGKADAFQAGLDALAKLTTGKVHLNLHPEKNKSGVFTHSKNVQINWFEGKHPTGNIGVQIHHIDPINKGETVWYMNPQDVLMLGRLFTEGRFNAERVVAATGTEAHSPRYYRTLVGCNIAPIVYEQIRNNNHNIRYVSGNALTGKKIEPNGYLGAYHHQLTFLQEGNHFEFLGWITPGLNKYSFSKTFLSGLLSKKEYRLDTNLHGGRRALVMTGEFEKVFPMDILPANLIKACIIGDIDLMEKLGIYEVDDEDFALCEFIDTSKTEIQTIIRNALDLVRKENE